MAAMCFSSGPVGRPVTRLFAARMARNAAGHANRDDGGPGSSGAPKRPGRVTEPPEFAGEADGGDDASGDGASSSEVDGSLFGSRRAKGRGTSGADGQGRRIASRLKLLRKSLEQPVDGTAIADVRLPLADWELAFDAARATGVTTAPEPLRPSRPSRLGMRRGAIDMGDMGADSSPEAEAAWSRADTELVANDAHERSSIVETQETAYLVGLELKSNHGRSGKAVRLGMDESLEELAQLAHTAGLKVLGRTSQRVENYNARTYIGAGKVESLGTAVRELRVDTVIFDDELSPAQARNLEKALGSGDNAVRICDRTALILDIFSQRARTKEGMLQVELAQTEYQLPRLTRLWSHLERQAGGGLNKGVGELQKEIDKRLLRDKIVALKRELDIVRGHRQQHRDRRAAATVPVIALVGYTNAGKSTLMNALSGADVLAEDKLFATLDPTTRKVKLPAGQEILVTDTVGFIQKLPTELVAAFRATLEEISEASLILHVVDCSHPQANLQAQVVEDVLSDLDVAGIPLLTVWNKADRCADRLPALRSAAAAGRPGTLLISAATGDGMATLQAAIAQELSRQLEIIDVTIPHSRGDIIAEIHRVGAIRSEIYAELGVRIQAAVPFALARRLGSGGFEDAAPK